VSINGNGLKRLPSVRTDVEAWQLVADNTAFVWWVINRWFKHLPLGEREDAYGFGIEGMFRAAQLWEPERGTFSTYATAWIRQRIERGLSDANDYRADRSGDNTYQAPISLEALTPDGIGYDAPAGDRPDLDAEWIAAIGRVADQCDEIDRKILAALTIGGSLRSTDLAAEYGVVPETIRRHQRHVRFLLGQELGADVSAITCSVRYCDTFAASNGLCASHDAKTRRAKAKMATIEPQ
jgi:RNA polymerase sigma factor (sigma-70 family)